MHLGDGERGLGLVRQALRISEMPARVFNPTHINRRKALFEEACELARAGCYVDMTAFPVADGEDAWTAADGSAPLPRTAAPADRITVSSDGGGCLPHFNADGESCIWTSATPASLAATLAELLDGGVAFETVLPAFTANPARLLRLHQQGSHRGRARRRSASSWRCRAPHRIRHDAGGCGTASRRRAINGQLRNRSRQGGRLVLPVRYSQRDTRL